MNLLGESMDEDPLDFVREMLRDWKKSELQINLESEGWEFISNHSVSITNNNPDLDPTIGDLRDIYKERYSEIRFEQAYNLHSVPLSRQRWVAVYVKTPLLTEICEN